jgi:very-short-patch-repair endonuclease
LRRALTSAEFVLWTRIRARQLGGFKFVQQEPIDRCYVDFVCRERRLIVEVDGGQHSESAEDKQRDSKLCALGYRVIRIWNNDVIENLDGVLQTLLCELEKLPLTQPSPRKRGEGDGPPWFIYLGCPLSGRDNNLPGIPRVSLALEGMPHRNST